MAFTKAFASILAHAAISIAIITLASAQNINIDFVQIKEPLGPRHSKFTYIRSPTSKLKHHITTFHNDIYAGNSTRNLSSPIGTIQGFCFEVFYNSYYECFHTITLPEGTLTAHGPYTIRTFIPTTNIVTGGGGIYETYRGEGNYQPDRAGNIIWSFKLWEFATAVAPPTDIRRLGLVSVRTRRGARSLSYRFLPVGIEAQPQRIITVHSQLRNSTEVSIGFLQGFCIETYYNVYFECLYTMSWNNNNTVTVQGQFNLNYQATTLLVTGTRGEFQKYAGQGSMQPEDLSRRTVWDMRFFRVTGT